MKLDRKCKRCKSTALTYSENIEVRYWAWWQWVIGWASTITFLIGALPFGLILLAYMIYSVCKKKRKVYTYTCQSCGHVQKV